MPEFSVVMVNWNARDLLRSCLRSVQKNIPKSLKYELIVVDNNSSDRSVEMVKKDFPKVILIANKKNLGFAKSVNQGFEVCKGENIMLLNPDVVVKNNCIKLMINKLESDKRIGAVGAKLISGDGKKLCPYVKFPTLTQILLFHTFINRLALNSNFLKEKYLLSMSDSGRLDNERVELIPGGCLMIKREILSTVGKMDTRFFLWFEDTDYCLRIKNKGWKLAYENDAEVIHVGFGSTKRLPTFTYMNIFYVSMYKYFQKHNGRVYASLSLLVIITDMIISSFIFFLLMFLKLHKSGTLIKEIRLRLKLAESWTAFLLGNQNEETIG